MVHCLLQVAEIRSELLQFVVLRSAVVALTIVLNLILGLVLGLCLGLFLVFVLVFVLVFDVPILGSCSCYSFVCPCSLLL